MKQTIISLGLLFLISIICSPLEALEDRIMPGEPPAKIIKSQGDVHLKRYGLRIINNEGDRKMKGLYKINIGNLDQFNDVYRMNRRFGFDGFVYFQLKHEKDHWTKTRVYRPTHDTQGRKETAVITKEHLPTPFNAMPDDLLAKIQFFNIYPENDGVVVVYPQEEAELSDCEVIFDYIQEQIWWSKNSITL